MERAISLVSCLAWAWAWDPILDPTNWSLKWHCPGLCWKGRATILWMWWTAWWPGGVTRWWGRRSRELCPTSTTRMTSRNLDYRLYSWCRFAMIYHLAKDAALRRANTIPGNLGLAKPLPVRSVSPSLSSLSVSPSPLSSSLPWSNSSHFYNSALHRRLPEKRWMNPIWRAKQVTSTLFIDWLIDWLTDWLIATFLHCKLTRSESHCFYHLDTDMILILIMSVSVSVCI